MTDEELREKIKSVLAELGVSSGHGEMTLSDIARIQPGLARLMPEVGQRAWKLYYAARARNWVLAKFQWKEAAGLLHLCAFTRPKHADALARFLADDWQPLGEAIDGKDFDTFETTFKKSIERANFYHEERGKPYLVWKLPATPPPDLDLEPRQKK